MSRFGRKMKTRMNRKASRKMNRKTSRKASRKMNRKGRKASRKMRGGMEQTYRSPLFVNLSDRYGADIGQGPALSQ